jgi:hypothetical protein
MYKVFQFSCVDIVSMNVFLKNVFALGEDVGSMIHVQQWHIICLYSFLHSPGRNHSRQLHRSVFEQQLNGQVSCVDACKIQQECVSKE